MMGTQSSVGILRECTSRGPRADMPSAAHFLLIPRSLDQTINMPATTLSPPATGPSIDNLLPRARAAREHIYHPGSLPDQAGTPLPVWPSGITRERGEGLRDL